MRHAMVSPSTSLNGVTKTSIGDITLPTNAKRVIGVWAHALGGAGNTTLENVTGIFELESESLNLAPMQFPLDNLTVTGTLGATVSPVKVWPVDWAPSANAKITGYITLDLAQSITGKGRWGLIYE